MEERSTSARRSLAIAGAAAAMTLASCGERTVELDQDFQKLLTYKFGESREPLSVIQDKISATSGKPEERLAIERQLAQLLRSEATYECKDFACRQLRVFGTKESVKTVAKLLTDEKLSNAARYALEANTDPSVDKELTNALKLVKGMALIGILNTLGERRKAENSAAIQAYASDPDAEVARAASDALAKISAQV